MRGRIRVALTGLAVLTASLVAAPAQAAAAEADLYSILPLGDSITYGVGNGYDSYREDLWRRLDVVGLRPNFVGTCPTSAPEWKCQYRGTLGDYNHEGHSGWRVDELALRIDYFLDWHKPRAILLLAGANDIAQSHDLPNLGERVGALTDRILTRRPGTHVFVGTLTQFADQRPIVGQVNQDIVANVNARDQRYVHLVPLHIVGDEPAKELADHVHPNECGYRRISYVWYYYMSRVYSPANPWPTGDNPFYASTGPCA